ncbi:MAG: YbfB/YjiJ family MFS transporter [Spirochaetales bacterium]|nr:YbfB/YjiJ family MFS transporter [Spirochaetales bacterium]
MEPNDSAFRNPYRFVILIVCILAVFAAIGLARFGFSMLLPLMQEHFDFDPVLAGSLGTANLAGYLIASLVGGIIAAKTSPRVVIAVSLLLVAFSMLVTGLVNNSWLLLLGRFFTGLGSGGANVVAMALLSTWFAKKWRGIASGFAVTGSSLGLAVSGIVVPWFAVAFTPEGFRLSWVLFSIITFVIFILGAVFLRKNSLNDTASPPDNNEQQQKPKARILNVIINPNLWLFGTLYFFFGFAYIIFAHFFGVYLQADAGFSPVQSGNLWSLVGIVSVGSGFIWGFVSDMIGRKQALCIIYAIHAGAFFLFGFSGSPGLLVFSAVLYGITAWSIPAIMAAAAGDLFGPGAVQIGFGAMTFLFGIGQAIGPVVGGAIAKAAGSYSHAFIVASGVSVVGLLLLLAVIFLGKRKI